MIRRIVKNIFALFAGNGVQVLTQLLLPPAFIAAYGVDGYGQWLVLFAAVGYVSSLDLGLQTYLINEVTLVYHKGDAEEFRRIQSIGMLLILGIIGGGMVLGTALFVVPLGGILNIPLDRIQIAAIVYILALQLLWGIGLVYLSSLYRVVGKAYRGTMWMNVQRIAMLVATIGLTFLRADFLSLAVAQAAVVLAMTAVVATDLRLRVPEIFPRIRFWDSRRAISMIKPSLFFGILMFNNFLIFQLPLLLMNWFLGAAVVAVFSIARMLFSFVRQGMGMIQMSISPEITRLEAIQDHVKLRRLYTITESLIASFSLILNSGVLILAPVILNIWLRRPDFFDPGLFALLYAVTGLMSIKEAKMSFHYWTNNHIGISIVAIIASCLLIGVSFPLIRFYGLTGFLVAWLAAEFVQTVIIHGANVRLIRNGVPLSPKPLVAFCVTLACTGVILYFLLYGGEIRGTAVLLVLALGIGMCLFFLSCRFFNLLNVLDELKNRWSPA